MVMLALGVTFAGDLLGVIHASLPIGMGGVPDRTSYELLLTAEASAKCWIHP
jgi:hypothetical protein